MHAKLPALSADQVMFDLEDAVSPGEKVGARTVVVESLRSIDLGDRVVSVRVNPVDTAWCYRDLVDVLERAGDRVDVIVLPKVNNPADVRFVDRLLTQIEMSLDWTVGRIGIDAQIESAEGLLRVAEIAASSGRLKALVFGPGDLSASLGLGGLTIGDTETQNYPGDVWHHALMSILIAARTYGLFALDGPFARFQDPEGLERSSRRSAALGFDGKWVIHPAQIEVVNRAFTPDLAIFKRAKGILDACDRATNEEGQGALVYEGEMIDEATRKMAAAIVKRGRTAGLRFDA